MVPAGLGLGGDAVETEGGWIITGTSGFSLGVVHIYRFDDGVWKRHQQIFPEIVSFGSALALDGDTLVVSAPFEDHSGLDDAGSAYVFQRDPDTNQWIEVQKLTASDAAVNDGFGWSLALDGDLLVIGAFKAGDDLEGWGAAYVFQRTGESWSEIQKIPRFAPQDIYFGWALALDDGWLAIGAPNDDDGNLNASVTIYQFLSGHFNQRQRINGYESMGFALALRGDQLVVGLPDYGNEYDRTHSGRAYLYQRFNENWLFQDVLLPGAPRSDWENSGRSVAIGNGVIAVGADSWEEPDFDSQGRLRLYRQDGDGTWVLDSIVEPIDRPPDGNFSFAAAIATEGETLVAGAPGDDEMGTNAGAAYVIDLTGQSGTRCILTDVAVQYGTSISAGVNHLKTSEDIRARIRSRFNFTGTDTTIADLRIGATSYVPNPASINLLIEGRITQPGGTMKVRLKNWNTNTFQQVHQYAIGTAENVVPVSGIPAVNYIRPADNRVEVSLRASKVVTFSTLSFEEQIDFVNVLVRD